MKTLEDYYPTVKSSAPTQIVYPATNNQSSVPANKGVSENLFVFLALCICIFSAFAIEFIGNHKILDKIKHSNIITKITKLCLLILAVAQLIAVLPLKDYRCEFDFYDFLRYLTLTTCVFLLINLRKYLKSIKYYGLVITLVLFNPVIPVTLEKGTWVIINICVSAYAFFLLNSLGEKGVYKTERKIKESI